MGISWGGEGDYTHTHTRDDNNGNSYDNGNSNNVKRDNTRIRKAGYPQSLHSYRREIEALILLDKNASFRHGRSETDSESSLSFYVLLKILLLSSVCALSIYLAIYLPVCLSVYVLIYFFASNMLISLSPCLTEEGSPPESEEIKAGGK